MSTTEHRHKAASTAAIVLAFGCLYFFWGSTYTAIRIGALSMPTLLLAGPRFLISGLIMLVWCKLRGIRILHDRRSMGMLLLLSVLLLGTGHIGLVFAERYIPTGLCSLGFAVMPLYVALMEYFLPGGEPLSARGWLGILLGFTGLAIMLAPSLHNGLHGDVMVLLALVALFTAALSWAVGCVVSRRAKLPVNVLVVSAWQMIFAGILNTLAATAVGEWKDFHPTLSGLGAVLYLVTFGSLVGYTAFIYLLEHVPVAKVMSYTYVNPVVAVLLGIFILHERPAPSEFAGMATIILAVFLMTSAQVRSNHAKSKA